MYLFFSMKPEIQHFILQINYTPWGGKNIWKWTHIGCWCTIKNKVEQSKDPVCVTYKKMTVVTRTKRVSIRSLLPAFLKMCSPSLKNYMHTGILKYHKETHKEIYMGLSNLVVPQVYHKKSFFWTSNTLLYPKKLWFKEHHYKKHCPKY